MDADRSFWLDLCRRGGSRREFLAAMRGAAALVAVGGALPATRADERPRFRSDPFTSGVASGDPTPDGIVLWTRLEASAVREAAAPTARVPVRWELADDDQFRRILAKGEALALPELGHSVHAEVDGLQPGRTYHYRFLAGGEASPVGRARTAPAVGAPVDRFRFAFASCQQYEHGYYTAYRHMAEEELDLIVHLGDYIYEKTWGDNIIRPHAGGEIFSLAQYRDRYVQYRSDPDLQAAHRAAAWVVTADDHEVDNDYAAGSPEDGQSLEAFLLRRAAAYQAYYEFMPLRRASMPAGPELGLYRRLDFGNLMSMHVLDTRQYRDDQPCGGGMTTGCEALSDPKRTLLGDPQEQWLFAGLRESAARWNVLAQQVMMAPMARKDARGQIVRWTDAWDGYPAQRQRVLDAFTSERVVNPVVITGDIHQSWVADLHQGDAESRLVATELIGTSITSAGDGRATTAESREALALNPHLRFFNGLRGYVSCDLSRAALTAHFRTVPYVTQPAAPIATASSWVVEDGRPGAQAGTA